MLSAYWKMGGRAPATREALYRDGSIPLDEFEAALTRIDQGEPAEAVLDDRFVDSYGLAGDPDDCHAGIARYAEVGVTELVLTFVGGEPLRDMALFGQSVGLSG
jgi:alkanesulfonate monooxygenase SsuD/methylene tetrahydromethanopterin reductase-like flavin-dependent oxidoreductase (luciferase family)